MVKQYSDQQKMLNFYDNILLKIFEIGKENGVNVQPSRVMMDDGSIHLSITGTVKSALEFYGDIWRKHSSELGLPDYLEPGMNVINPETGDEWILIGLDPVSVNAPVKLMNDMLDHFWVDISTAKELQPM